MIWLNIERQLVLPFEVFSDNEQALEKGFTQFSSPYEARLLHGETPLDWNNPVLPDRKHFHELASGSQLWDHISVHTPELSMLLYIALTASSELNHATVMQDVKNMMRGIVAQLGTDHALHSTQSLTMVNDPNDPEGLPISVGTLADELDTMLSESFVGFTYADLM
jgi:hypothetical protein